MALLQDVSRPVTGRFVVLLALVAGLALAHYGVGVLLPYLVNDLHRLPLAEVASGAHDPKDLWPQGAGAGWLQVAGLLAVLSTPLALGLVLLTGAVPLVDGRRHPVRRPRPALEGALAVVVVVTLLALVLLVSPVGWALASWRLD